MNIIEAILARFYHKNVDAVLGALSKAVARLDALERRLSAEASGHIEAARQANESADAAASEAQRAANVRAKLAALLS